jgi:class 3 adenylate cyclase
MVMVSGEPGIGKTRLAEEVGVYARLGGAQVLTGRCYEAESSVPYMPFVEAMRVYVASRPPAELRNELGGAASDVAKLVSDIRDRIPDLPAAPRHEGEEERYRLFEGVASFLVNAAASTPIVLVLDDLHWSDAPSLRLLQHVARRLADSPLLVVGTYRDVELNRRHPLSQTLAELRREHAYERIGLQGLSRDEVREFLAGITEREVTASEEPLVDAFYRATEGNPYFLEETARHLLETGGAYWEKGSWRVDAASVDSGIIPEGIRELIGRRLSTLSDACNDVLIRAAVLGPHFDFAVLERMTGLDEDPLLEALEEALQAQLVQQAGVAHGRPMYTFTHAVVRQTLYDELSLPRRQRLHRRAAEAIETVYAGNITSHLPALALHCRQAGAAGDPEKAVEYSVRAGEAAQAVYAHEDALRHWEAAAELMEDGAGDAESRAGLLARLGDLMFVTGLDYLGGIRHLEQALRLYEELGRADRIAQTHSRLGRDLSSYPDSTMDIPRALAHYRAAESILSQAPDSSALGYVAFGMAATADWGLGTDEGLAAAERAVTIAEKRGNEVLRRHAVQQRGTHLVAGGRLAEGFAEIEAAWQQAEAARDLTVAFTSAWVAGIACVYLGDPGTAKLWLERELGKPRLAQAPTPRRILVDQLALAHALSGDLAEARRAENEMAGTKHSPPRLAYLEGRFDEAGRLWTAQREEERRRGNRRDEWVATAALAALRAVEGGSAEAEELYGQALAIAVDGGERIFELSTRAELGRLLAVDGRRDEASGHLARCRAVLEGGEDWRGLAGRVDLAEAVLAAQQGRLDETEQTFARAVEVFRQYTLPWDEAEALHQWGLARREGGDRTGALEKLAGALTIYRRHRAGAQWIERVLADKLLAQGIDPTKNQTSIDLVAAAALDERPNLVPHTAPDGTVTLLFSDIEGSTALNEQLGDTRFLDLLHAHNQIVRAEVSAHGGFEVKSQGDGFMVAFSSAKRGLECAIAIQQAIRQHSEKDPERGLAVRIGLHTGEAVKEGEDFFGKHVAMAARVAGAASGGEILVSSVVKELADTGDIAFGPPRDLELKGFSQPRRLHDVLWEETR